MNEDKNIQPTGSPAPPSPVPQAQPVPTVIVSAETNPTEQPQPQPPVAPAPVVNGAESQPVVSITSGQAEQLSKSPSKWRYVFLALGILQVIGVGLYFLILSSVAGQTGSEFVALAVYFTLVPGIAIMALINLIGLPIYMAKQKPQGKGLALGITSLVISGLLVLYGAFALFQLFVSLPNQVNHYSEQTQQRAEERDQQFAADNAKPEITKDEAIELLKTCQLSGFYYTNQTDKDNGGWGELSTTGVVLTKIDGKPYRISIADRLIPELVPVAREAQKTCPGPQFWHDGNYEQKKADGTWQ